jgi:hypothetical protein
MEQHLLGVGKGDVAALESILGCQLAERLAAISRKPFGPVPRRPGKHVAPKEGCQVLIMRCRERNSIGRLTAVKRLSNPAHFPRHREVSNPHFAHIIIHIAAEAIEQALPQVAAPACRIRKTSQDQNGVEHDHLQAAVDGIGDPIDSVKGGPSRLRP